ncbi:MAG: hypothetical protein QME87_09885 [Bacillota bacterium]|nr:hypothetical protein [Bacillota bacterium]
MPVWLWFVLVALAGWFGYWLGHQRGCWAGYVKGCRGGRAFEEANRRRVAAFEEQLRSSRRSPADEPDFEFEELAEPWDE